LSFPQCQKKLVGFFLESFWFLVFPITNLFVFSSSFQHSQLKWKMITCHLTGQSEWCKTKQRITMGKFLRNTRFPQSRRCVWLFHCARRFPCQLWGLLSRLISWRWISHGIQGKGQGILFVPNELEGQGAKCFFA
jgi:hypothetical protein